MQFQLLCYEMHYQRRDADDFFYGYEPPLAKLSEAERRATYDPMPDPFVDSEDRGTVVRRVRGGSMLVTGGRTRYVKYDCLICPVPVASIYGRGGRRARRRRRAR